VKPSNAGFNKCLHSESNTQPPGGYAHVTSDFSVRLNLASMCHATWEKKTCFPCQNEKYCKSKILASI